MTGIALKEQTMDVFEVIYHRRTVRDYTDRMVPTAMLQRLLDVAVQAPSAMNQQPWAFAVFRGRERLHRYSDRAKAHFLATMPPTFGLDPRTDLLLNPGIDIFHNAGSLVVIYAKPGGLHPEEDCCLAAQTLMLAAHALGLATAAIGMARPWFNLPDVKDELEIPTAYTAVFPVTVGYPATTPKPVPRQRPDIVAWQEEFHPHAQMAMV